MERRAPLVLLLLVTLLMLAPLALASPPDPLWVGGVFDAGDTDDVVLAATSTVGTPAGPALDPLPALLDPAETIVPSGVAEAVGSPLSIRQGRAPPVC